MSLDQLILDSDGRFVTVEFVKKDGTVRTLTGRMGVKKYLKGGVSTLDPNQYITIFDVRKMAYRAVNRCTIVRVVCNGVEYK